MRVLQRDADPVKWPEDLTARHQGVRLERCPASAINIERRDGIQDRVKASHPGELCLQQVRWGHDATGDEFGQLRHTEVTGLEHVYAAV